MYDTISLLKIVEDTVVDGPGFRISLYAAGCVHHCKGCHNPQSWDYANGTLYSVDQLMEHILHSKSNITFTGGDPLFQVKAFTELARRIKERTRKTIWCYTGYLFETLLDHPAYRDLLPYIDVIVDGPFEEDKRDSKLLFRGSANQRLIDVQMSLKEKRTILFAYDPFPVF